MDMKTALLSKISRAVIFCKEVLYVLQALSMVFVGNGYYPFRNARRAFLLAVIFREEVPSLRGMTAAPHVLDLCGRKNHKSGLWGIFNRPPIA